jgi:hypothetical protein
MRPATMLVQLLKVREEGVFTLEILDSDINVF